MDELQLEVADYTDLDHWRWRLTDAGGAFLADYTVALDRAAPLYQAFVDLYPYLRYYAAPDRQLEHEAELLAEVGHWIGAQVWGPVGEKMLEAAPVTVRVRLPAAMAGLAYRPLELGYVQDCPLALQEVSLVLEVGEPHPPSRKQPINEALRMLAIFSLPTDTSVLGLRQERYALKRLIQRIAQTQRKAIELRVLQYGVTREQLQATLEEGEGWDVLHFSGHGLPAGLVLERPDGRQDRISVRDLERLLRPARRRLKLVTLSACESAAPTVQETLRWLKLPEPQRSEAEARAEPAPAIAAEPLPALARSLAESLGCAVLAMRYPVGDAFAIELAGRFYRALFEQRRNLPAALQLALPQALPADPQPGMPPLSVAAPALFGALAASLTLPLPPGASPPFDLSQPRMAEFPPESEHFVGRGGPLARGSMAMAPESGQKAVLFYGMAGVGKTACALERAYRYETGRFERLVWHKGLDEGHEIADALLRLAIDLERQLPGFTMAHAVDRADEFASWLPRLRELLEQRSILIVLDNLESLLTAEGHWRDARWEALMAVLMDHGGLSRTVMTSRRRPLDLRHEIRVLIEAIHPLSLAEAALLVRELPHLGALLQGKHPAGLEGGRELVTYALQVVQGHPKLLEFAEAQARDPQALAGHLAQAAADWERREGQLQAFFREGESDLPAEAFLVALDDWTRRVAGRLPPGVRTLFYMLCALEEEDRVDFVLKWTWSNLWRRLELPGEVPSLANGLTLIVKSGLIEARPEEDSITRYGLHPAVAEAGWAEAGAAVQAAVDRELAALWQAIFQQGMEAEEQRRGPLMGRGQLAVGAGWRAAPYLLRRGR
jgi:CHAT domain